MYRKQLIGEFSCSSMYVLRLVGEWESCTVYDND